MCCSPSKTIMYMERQTEAEYTNETIGGQQTKKNVCKWWPTVVFELIMQWEGFVCMCMWIEFAFINLATLGCWYLVCNSVNDNFRRPKIIKWTKHFGTLIDVSQWKMNSNYAKNRTMKPAPIVRRWKALVVKWWLSPLILDRIETIFNNRKKRTQGK